MGVVALSLGGAGLSASAAVLDSDSVNTTSAMKYSTKAILPLNITQEDGPTSGDKHIATFDTDTNKIVYQNDYSGTLVESFQPKLFVMFGIDKDGKVTVIGQGHGDRVVKFSHTLKDGEKEKYVSYSTLAMYETPNGEGASFGTEFTIPSN
ncbi:hypothetical protein [Weissella coleopterorum]|nr:hypothetical protein [Weissella coleopterorum]